MLSPQVTIDRAHTQASQRQTGTLHTLKAQAHLQVLLQGEHEQQRVLCRRTQLSQVRLVTGSALSQVTHHAAHGRGRRCGAEARTVRHQLLQNAAELLHIEALHTDDGARLHQQVELCITAQLLIGGAGNLCVCVLALVSGVFHDRSFRRC